MEAPDGACKNVQQRRGRIGKLRDL